MQITSNLFDHVLHYMGLSGVKPSFLVIGAMDGVSFDEFHNYIRTYRWSGLLVEPVPEQFRRLISNYATIGCSPNNKYENCAITTHNGTIKMLTIDQTAVDQGAVHACFGGMSAIYPPRNGLASSGDAETVRRFGHIIEVPCLTLESLLEKHEIDSIDVLCIDAEGWDFNILKQLDFKRWRPHLIRIEYINLSPEEKLAVTSLLETNQYSYRIHGQELDAVPMEYWETITKQDPSIPRSASNPVTTQGLTFVTSMLSLAADKDSPPALVYQRAVEYLHQLNADQPLIIFVAPGPTELAARTRSAKNTHIVVRRLEELVQQEQYHWIEQALIKSEEHSQSPSTEAVHWWLSLCRPFLFNDATIHNPFRSELFIWIDLERLPIVAKGLKDKAIDWDRAIEQIFSDARLWLPITAQHPRKEIEQLICQWTGVAAKSLTFSVAANTLAGSKLPINIFNGAYYACLERALSNGVLCSPEEIFTMLAYTQPYLFNTFAADQLALSELN